MNRFLSGSLVILLSSPVPLLAQDSPATMPAGWQSMSPEAFTDAAETCLTAENKPTDETVKAIVEHAWNTVLTDANQIATGNWATVEVLADLIVPRRGAMLAGLEGDARQTAEGAINAQLKTLHANLKNRLQAEDALVAGVAIDEWRDRDGAMARAGMPHTDRAELNQLWKSGNDWQALPVDQLAWLTSALNVDQVNPNNFSARWTGTITAPQTGNYTFEQLRQPLANGAMKLFVNGNLVLDTTDTIENEEGEQALSSKTDAAAFRSKPVPLTAGQPAELQVDYVYDNSTMKHDARYGYRNFGIVTLLWESDNLQQQLIPPSAFKTPTGEPGIAGEYFKDSTFTESAGKRVDGSLQLVFSGRTVLSEYTEDQQEICNYARPRLVQMLSTAAAEAQPGQLAEACGRMVPRMTAGERLQFLSEIASQPALIEKMSDRTMADLMIHTFMLPTKDHLDLMAVWGESHDPPPCRPGKYPSWGWDYYRSRNYDPTAAFVGVMWGDMWPNAEYMIENHLAREDGSCNLAVVYAVAIPARFENKTTLLRNKVDEILADETLTGDDRARWLLARKFLCEVCIDYPPNPIHGMPYLEEAVLTAESPGLRYRLNVEHAAKLMSLDEEQQAMAALDRAAAVASTPEQQEEIAALRKYAAELTKFYVQHRIDSVKAQRAASDRSALATLRQAQQEATDRGDTATADRYAARAANLQAALEAEDSQ